MAIETIDPDKSPKSTYKNVIKVIISVLAPFSDIVLKICIVMIFFGMFNIGVYRFYCAALWIIIGFTRSLMLKKGRVLFVLFVIFGYFFNSKVETFSILYPITSNGIATIQSDCYGEFSNRDKSGRFSKLKPEESEISSSVVYLRKGEELKITGVSYHEGFTSPPNYYIHTNLGNFSPEDEREFVKINKPTVRDALLIIDKINYVSVLFSSPLIFSYTLYLAFLKY